MHARISLKTCGIAGMALLLTAGAPQDRLRIRTVTDGDTFRLATGERIRIAGIDAPETRSGQARCATEMTRGDAATRRAHALLVGRSVGISRVGRSYGRTVASVTLDGRDLATMLVANGIARWWPRHLPKPDWCDGATERRAPPRRRAAREGRGA